MKLTYGIPTYNGGKLLQKTVESCLSSTLSTEDYEILVVDNCSTDDSIKNIKQLQKHVPHLRVVENTHNYGRIGNRNRVLEEAKGDSVLFLMVGDISLPDNDLEKRLEQKRHFVYSFENSNDATVHNHFAQDFEPHSTREVLQKSIRTLGYNFGLPPLQNHIISLSVVREHQIRFDEELEFLADLKFLHAYTSYIPMVQFLSIPNIVWNSAGNKFTFTQQIRMFEDIVNYYPHAFEKHIGKKIPLVRFKSTVTLHIFFLYLNNLRTSVGGFRLFDMCSFIWKYVGFFYFFALFFIPLYILYLYINNKNNYRYLIKL